MEDLYGQLLEVTHSGLLRKQRSITRLFPDFQDKVKGIADKGGLRLADTTNDAWHFKVHSGTKDSVWYDDWFQFKNMYDLLDKHVRDTRLWTRDKQHVDLRKLAKKCMFNADVKVSCTCKAFKYWGSDYIVSLSKYDAKYGSPEVRAPNVRNPKQYGAVCKHLQNVLNVLPWYITTMATWLREHYTDEIREIENANKSGREEVGRQADALRRRQRPEPEEPDEPGREEEERPEDTDEMPPEDHPRRR